MRVLVVEDEESLAHRLKNVLESDKYHTELAFDGQMGLEKALIEEYDSIISSAAPPISILKSLGIAISSMIFRTSLVVARRSRPATSMETVTLRSWSSRLITVGAVS